MSVYELAERYKFERKCKLFVQEVMKDFTIDKVVYNVSFQNNFFIINHKKFKCKLKITFNDLQEYFDYRNKYLEQRRIFLNKNKQIYSPSMYDFYNRQLKRNVSNYVKTKIEMNIKKG